MNNNNNVTTEKNKPTLLVDGFLFIRDKQYKEKTYWLCNDYKPKYCKARLHTNSQNGEIIKVIGEHTHAANASNIAVRRIITEMNEKAKTTHDSTQLIIAECSNKSSYAVKLHMPSEASLQRAIKRIRQGNERVPQTMPKLNILDQYKITEVGKPFLLYDSGAAEQRTLLFSTEENLHFLCDSSVWYVDGSLKAVPLLFNHLFTIYGIKEKLHLPLVYALLPNNTTQTYQDLFEQLKFLCPNLNPTIVWSDFDQTIVNAIQFCFSGAKQHFSLFHLAQNVYRKLSAAGFKRNYDEDATFAHNIRMLLALAFVPSTDVINAFESFKDENVIADEFIEVLDYFEDNYVGRLDTRFKNITGRRDPKYAIQAWNVHEVTKQGLLLTHKNVAGWHNKFEKLITAKQRPSVWCILEKLQSEQSKTEIVMQQIIGGMPPQKRKYRDHDQRLKNIVTNYSSMAVIEFLSNVALNITI